VLIGAFDNIRTMRDLRFGFEYGNLVRSVVDRKRTQRRSWILQLTPPYSRSAQDYAMGARIHDNVTRQSGIIWAGNFGEGTQAAGELAGEDSTASLHADFTVTQ